MSIVSQNNTNEVALLDCIQRFFSKHQVGKLLKKCNGTKEKRCASHFPVEIQTWQHIH